MTDIVIFDLCRPVPDAQKASDTFEQLHKIVKPMLLLHGKDDDICPLSQSFPAFNSLETRSVPTGIVVCKEHL